MNRAQRFPRLAALLRRPSLLLAGALLVGSALFEFSLSARIDSEYALIRARAAATAAARALREAPARLAQARHQETQYRQIQASGFLAGEDRAGWISALADLRQRLALDNLAWRLHPGMVSELAPPLRVTVMEIGFVSHDADTLARVLADLRANAPGRFTVTHCALAPEPTAGGGDRVDCRLIWWTAEAATSDQVTP